MKKIFLSFAYIISIVILSQEKESNISPFEPSLKVVANILENIGEFTKNENDTTLTAERKLKKFDNKVKEINKKLKGTSITFPVACFLNASPIMKCAFCKEETGKFKLDFIIHGDFDNLDPNDLCSEFERGNVNHIITKVVNSEKEALKYKKGLTLYSVSGKIDSIVFYNNRLDYIDIVANLK